MKDFIASFKNYLTYKNKSKATKRAYINDINQFSKVIKKDLLNIESTDVEAFKKYLKLNDYTNDSITRKLNSLNSFYKWLKYKNEIDTNPINPVAYPKSIPTKQRILSKEECRQLLAEARNDLRTFTIFSTLLYTGMKISELHQLKIKDLELDFKSPKIKVKNSSSSIREVPLNDKLLFILNTYFKDFHKFKSQENFPLFYTTNKNPILIRNLRVMLDKLFKNTDTFDAKVNDIRNTFIVRQLEAGNSIEFVGKVVGHKSRKATERYLKFVENYEEKSIDTIMDF